MDAYSSAAKGQLGQAISESLLLHCVRIVVHDYGSALQRRPTTRPPSTITDGTRTSTSQKVNSRNSVMEMLSSTAFGSREKKKFPKELIKALEEALKKVIMRQEPAYEEALVRGSFGAFYAYYVSDAFQKSIKDNRKIEDIILMFISRATAELHKRVSEAESKDIVITHVAKFVRLLLQIIRVQKLAAPDSDLVVRLVEYDKKLTENARYVVPIAKQDEHHENITSNSKITVEASPLLQKLAWLSDLSMSTMQTRVNAITVEATDQAFLDDLKILLDQIQVQGDLVPCKEDFRDEATYVAWRQKEMTDITSRILKLTTMNPRLAETSVKRSAKALTNFNDLSSLSIHEAVTKPPVMASTYFIPAEPFKAYSVLVLALLRADHQPRAEQSGEQTVSLLSNDSLELLSLCRDRWRLSNIAHKVALIHACCTTFMNGDLTLDELDHAFFDVDSHSFHQDQYLTKELESQYTSDLLRIHDALFRDLYADLLTIYECKVDAQALTFMNEYLYSDPCFIAVAPQTAHMFDELEKALEQAAEQRYRVHRDAASDPTKLEVLHIVKIIADLRKDISILQKRYPRPILDIINIWSLYIKVVLRQVLYDLKPLLEQCYRNAKADGAEFAIEDMFQLYGSVSDVLDTLRKHEAEFDSPVNIDLYFRPYVLKWLQQANMSIMSLVSKVLSADEFLPQGDESESTNCSSESISLLFKSFTQHLAYLRALHWPDEYWNAKFVTILTHTFSNATKDYCLQVQQMFMRECVIVPEESNDAQSTTLQKRLFLKARDALAKREPIEPLNISRTACVKLNNVVSAKTYLNILEDSVDSAALTTILERYEGQSQVWSPGRAALFAVKLISAHDVARTGDDAINDAYVVLSDSKGRRIGKTRNVFTHSDPRWEESFDVPTNESMWLSATIWDRSTSVEHDIRGRCFFKLDPSNFVDLVPREFSIALNTQGYLRVRITMEIEADESTFYFARAFRYLTRAEGDMSRSIVERMTPFINTALSRHNLRTLHARKPAIDALDTAYTLLSKAGFQNTKMSSLHKDKSMCQSQHDFEAPIEPLMQYLDDNFRTLDGYLNREAFLTVMLRLWENVLSSIEDMIVPTAASKTGKSKQSLSEEELDTCYMWLGFLKDTFAGDGGGLSQEELQTSRYHELLALRFFYFDPIDDLIQECEQMVRHTTTKLSQMTNEPLQLQKAYNLGTIKHNYEQKRAYQRALATSEDTIMRVRFIAKLTNNVLMEQVLRLRNDPRAQAYIHRRLKAKGESMERDAGSATVMRHSTIHNRHETRRQ